MRNKTLLSEAGSPPCANHTMTGFNTIGSGGGGYIGGSNCCNAGTQGDPKFTWDPVPGAIGYEIRARFSIHSYQATPQIYSTTTTDYSFCCHGGCPCSYPLNVGMHFWGVRPVCSTGSSPTTGEWQGTGGIAIGGGQTSPYESESMFSAGGGSPGPPSYRPGDAVIDDSTTHAKMSNPTDTPLDKDRKLREEKNRIKELIKKIR